jgi:hypothetical protein
VAGLSNFGGAPTGTDDRLAGLAGGILGLEGGITATGTVDGWPMWIDGFGEARAA